MKSSKFLLGIGLAASTLVLSVVTIQNVKQPSSFFASYGDPNDYTLTLDNDDVINSLTSSYQNNVSGTVTTSNGNSVSMKFVAAKNLDNGFVQLAPHGKIYNFDGGSNVLSVNAVKFTGSGSLTYRPGVAIENNSFTLGKATTISADSKTSVTIADRFELEAGDSGAVINTLELFYSCSETESDVSTLNGKYTGIGNDSFTYLLTINDGSVSIASLDKPSNDLLSGTVQMLSRTRAKCTFVYNTYNIFYTMDFDGHSFSFVEKSDEVGGSAANQVTVISTLNRVYNVEDFESYSANGQGYTNSTTKWQTTGLRAKYYADYYTGSSSGEIGGNGWPVMTSTDNTNYNGSKGHNSSKTGIFKFSNGMGMRYISMNELYGVKSVIGKGSTLSLWARGAYTNTNFSVNHANNISMKVYAYYDSPLIPSNQTTVRESFDFTVNAGSEWQHFEFSLTANRKYYGFGIYAQQSSGSTMYVPIDDVEIYTASPYAEYVAPVAVSGVTVSPSSAEVEIGHTTSLTATVSPNDATNKEVNWFSSNTSIATVSEEGIVTGVAAGEATITATTVDGGYNSSCTVTVSEPVEGPFPAGTFKGSATVLGNSYALVIALGNRGSDLCAVRLANQDAVVTGFTYNDSTSALSIETSGSYSGYSYGTITGTYDSANNRITNISCSGGIKSYVSDNGSIVATLAATSSNSLYEECEGTTQQLQSRFKRRYMSGSWQVDSSNADRITSNTTEFVCGEGAVKRRGYSGGAVALNFNSDFSPAKTVANVQFWVYNPSGSDIVLRMWGYKAGSFGSNFETGSVTAKAGQWTYLAMGFTSAAIYNFQIADFNNTGTYLTFDNIYLF